jgi:molecular chaperone HscB
VNEQDHFALFGLPHSFSLDASELDAAWKRVSMAVHPDRFATASAVEKRVAVQWSARANEALRILKDPLSRARYMCESAGVDLQTETNTAMSADFLMQQMHWHEQLDTLSDHPDAIGLQAFKVELSSAHSEITADVQSLLDEKRYAEAAKRVREWMFLDKLIKITDGLTADI